MSDEAAYLGEPLDDVPKREPGYECNGRKKLKRDGEVVRDDEGNAIFDGYCQARAGKGTDHVGNGRCKFHGGASDNAGENNGNYKHGAFSKHFRSDLTEAERAALEDAADRLDEPEDARALAIEMAAEAALKYKRTGDTRFQREFRQMCEAFNITPSDELAISVDGLEAAFMENLRSAHDE